MNTGAVAPDLAGFLAEEGVRVDGALRRALQEMEGALPPPLMAPLRHGVLVGGKRLRPILCVAAYRASGGTEPGIDDVAAALELIHAYSLMHDDLPCMDDADLRRGRPTPHRVHGVVPTAVAGAALIPAALLHAYRATLRLTRSPVVAARVVREIAGAAGGGGMVGGQALDLLAEGTELTPPALDRLHALKTGALLAASLRVGGIAAGAPEGAVDALDRYGRRVGLAFQIVDDLLDATGSVEELGKNPSDREMGKSTYVSLHGVEYARERAVVQVEAACQALTGAGLDSPLLAALARYMVGRTH